MKEPDKNTEFYVYAGYYELYISSEPMPEPYMWQATFDDVDEAIEFAEDFEDNVIYCENVKEYISPYLAEILEENNEFFKF